jgi:hypothetical protein
MQCRGDRRVDCSVLAACHFQRLDLAGAAAEQPGGGIEEADAVLDEDPAAGLGVPEPVVGWQVLIAGEVLEGEDRPVLGEMRQRPRVPGDLLDRGERYPNPWPRVVDPGGQRLAGVRADP